MLKILILSLFSFTIHAAEVVTVTTSKAIHEISVVMTEESLHGAMEKHFMAQTCKPRFATNSIVPVREIYFAKVCRAEVVKFLLNNGYKPDQHFETFTK